MSTSAAKRHRSVANPEVGIQQYQQVFESWLEDNPGTLPALLGRTLVSNLRSVTPGHVVSLVNLLERLFSCGLDNAMILPSKFEAAIRATLAANPSRAGKSSALDLYAHEVCEHIRHCFSMLRVLRLEQNKPSTAISKTGAFKRKANTAENIIINSLVGKVNVKCGSHPDVPASESGCASVLTPASSVSDLRCASVTKSTSATSVIEKSEGKSDLPDCFWKFLKKCKGAEVVPAQPVSRMSTPLSSPRSTVFYDEDGFPDIISGMYSTPISAKQLVPSNDLTPEPVIPTTKEREKQNTCHQSKFEECFTSACQQAFRGVEQRLGAFFDRLGHQDPLTKALRDPRSARVVCIGRCQQACFHLWCHQEGLWRAHGRAWQGCQELH